MGHLDGWQPPVYSQDDRDQIVRGLFVLADLVEADSTAGRRRSWASFAS